MRKIRVREDGQVREIDARVQDYLTEDGIQGSYAIGADDRMYVVVDRDYYGAIFVPWVSVQRIDNEREEH